MTYLFGSTPNTTTDSFLELPSLTTSGTPLCPLLAQAPRIFDLLLSKTGPIHLIPIPVTRMN